MGDQGCAEDCRSAEMQAFTRVRKTERRANGGAMAGCLYLTAVRNVLFELLRECMRITCALPGLGAARYSFTIGSIA